ncbi:MAG: hypothetical protein IJ339_05665, partial [Oscillospiraceae bacterium]|nr:hypothetical protein [Oscillospiraceae bacterium]
ADIILRPTTSFETSFNIVKRSESSVQVVDSFRVRMRYKDTNLGEDLGIVRTNDLASLPQGVLVQFDMCMMQGANPSTAMFYMVKKNNTGAEFALYDSINLSTLKVYTTDSSKVYPAEFTIQNRSGENAIGIAMQVTGTDTPFAEEILITFEDVNGKKYYAYTEASCYPQYSGESAEVTVGTVDEFLDAYSTIPGGTIYVKGGTYSFDFVHNRNGVKIVGIGDENNPTIFNGASNSAGPVLKLLNNENFSFEGITVDGRNKTRIGVYADQQSSLRVNDITVQNCSIGAICDSVYTGHFISYNLFKNNTIGFYIKYCYAALEENRFENNGTAIYISKDINDTVYIKNNTFIGNTTADIDNDSTSDISVSQNYFGTDENTASKPKIKEKNGCNNGRVFFSPYYTKVDRSEMDATLDGAQHNEDGSYTVPVDTSLGGGYLLGDQLFNEMKNSKDPVLVSVPLSAVNNGKMEVVAIWEFTTENVDSEADRPDGTNLEVTDTPSSEASS